MSMVFLWAVLSQYFVGFRKKVFESHCKFHVYLCYIDDTFSIFDSIEEAEAFRILLWRREGSCFACFGRTGELFSVYVKPTSKCLYINPNSFVPKSHKIHLIGTLFRRALMICSPYRFDPKWRTFIAISLKKILRKCHQTKGWTQN